MKYTKHFSTKQTAQSLPIPGKQMIENNAGGFVFEVSASQQFTRFLILGSEGGSYYSSEAKLTQENATNAIKYIQSNGEEAVKEIVRVSTEGLAAKPGAAIFALALASTFGDVQTKSSSYKAIAKVCRTGTHLFQFVQSIQDLRGWSSGLRKGVSNFYLSKKLDKLDLQLVKYRQRDGWTHRDVLRLCHAHGTLAQNKRFAYAVGKAEKVIGSKLIAAFEKIKNETDELEAIKLIIKYNLPWETVPTEMLKSVNVWAALTQSMGYTALLRNLGKLTSIGLIKSNFDSTTQTIAGMLTDPELVKKSRVHPFAIFTALKTYQAGHGFKGSLSWTPNSKIIDALNDAFELAMKNVVPTGKNILIGVDVSGSMGALINNTNISAAEAGIAMALITARVEPNCEVIKFDTGTYMTKIGKRSSLTSAMAEFNRGGGTDCSQPIQYALKGNLDVDAIVIYTDNETWAGNMHAEQAVRLLNKKLGKQVKIINAATTATNATVSDAKDINSLNIVGFDSSAPSLISLFIGGEL